MDAERTLRLWRRLLREDALWDARDELSLEEREILSAFRAHRDAAYWPIQGYRYRQVDQLVTDVASSAEISTTVLRAHGHDLKLHARAYFEGTGWRDFGWRAEHGCDAFLGYLATELAARVTGLSDVIALDRARLRLLIRLADVPLERWPSPASSTLSDNARYRRSPAATAITSERDLSPWLADPEQAHLVVPSVARQHLLVYLPSREDILRLAALSDDAAFLFDGLGEARTIADVAALFGGATGMARARSVLVALANIGVLCEAPASA